MSRLKLAGSLVIQEKFRFQITDMYLHQLKKGGFDGMFHVAWKWKAIQGINALSLSCASPALSNPAFLCPECLFFTSLLLFSYTVCSAYLQLVP